MGKGPHLPAPVGEALLKPNQARSDSTPGPLPALGCGISSTLALFSGLDENDAVALLQCHLSTDSFVTHGLTVLLHKELCSGYTALLIVSILKHFFPR